MSHSRIRTLIVDDEPHVRQYLSLVLKGLGMENPSQAGSVDEARTLHTKTPCDLILLDLNLPGQGGMVWLRELRAAEDEAVVVMVSSTAGAASVLEAAQQGADGYLRKDMRREELAAELARILADSFGNEG